MRHLSVPICRPLYSSDSLGAGVGVHLHIQVSRCVRIPSAHLVTMRVKMIVHTFRFPPVRVMLTKRRVYLSRLRARPLGTLGFS